MPAEVQGFLYSWRMQIYPRAGSSVLHMSARISWREMSRPLAACRAPPKHVRPYHSAGCCCCCPVLPVSRHHSSPADAQVSQEGCIRCRKRRENQAGHQCESLRMPGAGEESALLHFYLLEEARAVEPAPALGACSMVGSLLEQQDSGITAGSSGSGEALADRRLCGGRRDRPAGSRGALWQLSIHCGAC
ncbi:uncharacterized protein LOC113485279 [Athene cunicularia]|uniref:uncharacterized protein LOC113485279 n=1 Tax=Athene cunicularia TaxID=194338 RepID=UPI000EF64A70|nr:uncharacterized protein LOC113485279 [Athene cunicularia]